MLSANSVPCKWCGQPAIESHSLPASILRTAKTVMGDNPGLRPQLTPNLVVQNTGKSRLLCKTCDNSFSPAEKLFREKLYAPLLAGKTEFEYDEWLTRFIVSIGWKRLATGLALMKDWEPDIVREAEKASTCWQDFLQGKRTDAGHYQHHLFLTWLIEKESIAEIVWQLLRNTFECSPIPAEGGLWIQSTMPGCILISLIYPNDFQPWDCANETRIGTKGKFGPNQRIPERVILAWAQNASRDNMDAAMKISEKQRQINKELVITMTLLSMLAIKAGDHC